MTKISEKQLRLAEIKDAKSKVKNKIFTFKAKNFVSVSGLHYNHTRQKMTA